MARFQQFPATISIGSGEYININKPNHNVTLLPKIENGCPGHSSSCCCLFLCEVPKTIGRNSRWWWLKRTACESVTGATISLEATVACISTESLCREIVKNVCTIITSPTMVLPRGNPYAITHLFSLLLTQYQMISKS